MFSPFLCCQEEGKEVELVEDPGLGDEAYPAFSWHADQNLAKHLDVATPHKVLTPRHDLQQQEPEPETPAAVPAPEETEVPESEETAAGPVLFDVVVLRDAEPTFGINLSLADQVCMVADITDGTLIGKWNETCDPAHKVKRGDRVFALNKRCYKAKDVPNSLKIATGKITVTFQRPRRNKVTLHTGGQSLGISLREGPDFLLVFDIFAGVVAEYNKSVCDRPGTQLRKSSRITSVDGVKGTGEDLMKLIRSGADAKEERTLEFITWC
eukprot:TRINITY_DN71827_c0_g1_i1.p1 TRINITY_DN71827_c0_g1~~TRINITY_DN71827_c0_g1_i1.p1  ORF type:complete len:282 (-),score=47.42 TRINITY_DN71827_c0_g1_i1:100-903(-)